MMFSDPNRCPQCGERVSPYGEIVTPLAEEDVQRAARMIQKRGIESVAVVYMDSFMNPKGAMDEEIEAMILPPPNCRNANSNR